MRIEIKLPKETQIKPPFDRANHGELRLIDGEEVVFEAECLGKGKGSKTAYSANWMLKNCDTPPGDYLGDIQHGWIPQSSFGPHPVISLKIVGGGALLAKEEGRDKLAIHGGGDPQQRYLYSTQGCIRMWDNEQKELTDILIAAGVTRNIPVKVTEE